MQLEEEGKKFYLHASALAKDKLIQNLFEFLAQQENDHREYFSAIAQELRQHESPDIYSIDINQNLREALHRAKSSLFRLPAKLLNEIQLRDVLESSIRSEDKTVDFYTEIDRTLITKYHPILIKIIEEEKMHVTLLANVLRKASL